MTDRRRRHAVVCVQSEVYVMGGYEDFNVLNRVEKLDAQKQTWSQLTPMKKGLVNHLAVNIGRTFMF